MNRRRLFQTRDRGAVLPIVALLLPVLMIMTAFAVDLGRQRTSRRDMQAVADMVALDMARLADGRTVEEIRDGMRGGLAIEALSVNEFQLTAVRNDLDANGAIVEFGRWDGTTFTGPFGTIVPPSQFVVNVPGGRPNAVRVSTSETTEYYFQPGSGSAERVAVARHGRPSACFSIGSFAAGLTDDNQSVLATVLGSFFGASPQLQVIGYQGLAAAEVNILDLVEALPGVGTPNEVLTAPIAIRDLLDAMATVLANDAEDELAAAIDALVLSSDTTLNLGAIVLPEQLLAIEPGAEGAALKGTVNVLDLVTGTALLADGDHAIDLPALGVNLPGVTVDGTATLIEAMRTHCVGLGGEGSTAQVRLALNAKVAVDAQALKNRLAAVNPALGYVLNPVVSVLDGLLAILLAPGCLVFNIGCPADPLIEAAIEVRAAGADARLEHVACPDDEAPARFRAQTETASVGVRLRIAGKDVPPAAPAQPLVYASLAGGEEQIAADPPFPTTDPIGTGDLGLTDVQASLLGAALEPFLGSILAELDQKVLHPILGLVGLDVIGGDLITRSTDCDGVELVV